MCICDHSSGYSQAAVASRTQNVIGAHAIMHGVQDPDKLIVAGFIPAN